MFSIKRYLKIVGLIAGIFICSSAFAQSSYYYYGAEIQRPLFLSTEKVTVKFLPTLTFDDIDNFIQSESALDQNRPLERTLESA